MATKAPSRAQIDDRVQHSVDDVQVVLDVLRGLPDPDCVGLDTVIEIIGDGYAVGWAFIDDGNRWSWTPFDGTLGDVSSME
jgi:hypothetical protein